VEGRWFFRLEGDWLLCFSKLYTLIDWVKVADLFADLTTRLVEQEIAVLQEAKQRCGKKPAVRSNLAAKVGRFTISKASTAAVGAIPLAEELDVSQVFYHCDYDHILMARQQGGKVVYFVRKLQLKDFRISTV